MLLKSDSVRRERKKLRRTASLVHKGVMSKEKLMECYGSWRNHASKGNNYKLVHGVDNYLKELIDNGTG